MTINMQRLRQAVQEQVDGLHITACRLQEQGDAVHLFMDYYTDDDHVLRTTAFMQPLAHLQRLDEDDLLNAYAVQLGNAIRRALRNDL